MTFADMVKSICKDLADFLIAKNKSYGDSALSPVSIFAPGKPGDLIRVRIDDKLSRIKNSPTAFGEDAPKDLAGYLVLFAIALEKWETEISTAQKIVKMCSQIETLACAGFMSSDVSIFSTPLERAKVAMDSTLGCARYRGDLLVCDDALGIAAVVVRLMAVQSMAEAKA